MDRFVQRHKDKIKGVVSCYDRVILTGTLPDLCHASAMAGYLSYRGIRLFDYPKWAEPLREEVRIHAEAVAKQAGSKIDFIRSQKAFRKEERVKEIIAERGAHPGLVHVFSAMESCPSYRPWHDKNSGKKTFKLAQVRKSIYSLRDLKDLMSAANRRYLTFMSDIDDPYVVRKDMDKLAGRTRDKGRSFRGFNLFDGIDLKLLLTIAQGEWTISGFRAVNLRQALGVKPGRASYLIKLLHVHGLMKKIGHQYKYYLTKAGRRVISTALFIREKLIVLQTVPQTA